MLADQYSLALIAAELLGGLRIPRVVQPCDLEAKRQLFADLEAGKRDWAKRSSDFAGVVCRMLRADPEQRWPSMSVCAICSHEIDVSESDARTRPKESRFRATYASRPAASTGEKTFFSVFYRTLFALAPDVERYFQAGDMERQYGMLNRAIHALLERGTHQESAADPSWI